MPDDAFRACLQHRLPSFFEGDSLLIDSANQVVFNYIDGYENFIDCSQFFLTQFDIDRKIESIDGLRFFKHASLIDFYENEISDVSEIGYLDSLEYINLDKNPISAYPDFSRMANLGRLRIPWAGADLPDLDSNIALRQLYIRHSFNSITPVSPIAKGVFNQLKNLEDLDLGHNIKDFSIHDSLYLLKRLHLNANNLDFLDLSPYANIRELSAVMNNLEEIDVSHLNHLKNFSISFNPIPNMDLSNNDSLKIFIALDCENLREVEFSSIRDSLFSITIRNSEVKSLPSLESSKVFSSLYIPKNKFEQLPTLPQNARIYTLNIEDNYIEDLSEVFKINSDGLTYLDIKGNKLDFSDAKSFLYLDSVFASATVFWTNHYFEYTPQKPFGDQIQAIFPQQVDTFLTIKSQKYAESYQWFKDGEPIAGATDTILHLLYTQSYDEGVYTCKSYGSILQNMQHGGGISEFVSANKIVSISSERRENSQVSVFPSPAIDLFTVEYYTTKPTSTVEIFIYDLTGKRKAIINKEEIRGKHTLELNVEDLDLASGVYGLRFVENNVIHDVKFLVAK